MSWKLRATTDEGGGSDGIWAPDYGPQSDYFTIKFHLSGIFKLEPHLSYVDGKTCFVDYCSVDELSAIELSSMLAAMGVEGQFNLYYSCTGVDDCDFLEPILSDQHALDLGLFGVGCIRIVGVFIDHQMLPGKHISFPTVAENIGFYGDNEEAERIDEEAERIGVGVKDDEGSSKVAQQIIDYDSGDSDDVVSLGDDSQHSEYIGESEGNYEVDNRDYEAFVDPDEEWGGLNEHEVREKGSIPEIPVREMGGIPDIPDREGEGSPGPSNVFKHKEVDKSVELELGMCFTDADDFRRTVKLHDIVLGRELIFPINNKYKVQARCKNDKCEWLVYASSVKADDTFRIKTIHNKHNCPRLKKVVHANSSFLAEKYIRHLKSDPKWPIRSMLEMIGEENKLSFTKWQMYRCKRKVATVGAGLVSDQYR